jgi:hypothetical protein
MPTKAFKVLVIGAGLAGLTPAQGLLWQGVVVEVLERDTAPLDRSQGYRIHVNPTGTALRGCLSDELFELLLDTSGSGGEGLRFTDHLLRQLLSLHGGEQPGPAAQPPVGVPRDTAPPASGAGAAGPPGTPDHPL